jgi:hypothetical protein
MLMAKKSKFVANQRRKQTRLPVRRAPGAFETNRPVMPLFARMPGSGAR